MQDILYIAIAMAFLAICVAYVRALDRLVRSTEAAEATTQFETEFEDAEPEEVPA